MTRYTLGATTITTTHFRALGWPCKKEVVRTYRKKTPDLVTVYFSVRTDECPEPARGLRQHVRQSLNGATHALDGLLRKLEEI